jgi:glyoxylase-like metal-dependent hydrolase (beta-lactamase superfamily II)
VALGAADIHLAQDPQLADPKELTWFEEFLRDTGTPAAIAAEVQAGLKRRRTWALEAARDQPHRPGGDGRWPTQLRYRHFKPDRVLFDGDEIDGTKLQVIHCPGHTPGNIVLYEADEGWLFSGDQLLPAITPTPAVQIAPEPGPSGHWRFASLPRFLDSMHRIRDLALTRCWPGHGAPFDNVREVIDENIAQIEQRTEKVLAAIHRHGEATVYDLASDLYPRALKRRYWQIVATIQGHLDILVERELVSTSAGKYVRL